MRIPSLVRLPKNKRFDYTARYYSPMKEDLADRKNRIARKDAKSTNPEETKAAIRYAFRRSKTSTDVNVLLRVAIVGLIVSIVACFHWNTWLPLEIVTGIIVIIRLTRKRKQQR